MKKVLIITYYWPPAGGPGVQRMLKFVKYLPTLGWEPIILTVENGEFPAIDESLLNEIPDNIKIFKSRSNDLIKKYKRFSGDGQNQAVPVGILSQKELPLKKRIARFIRLNFVIPDAKKSWIKPSVKVGQKIIDDEKPQIIFSSSPPPSVHLIAKKLARKNNLKWVADLRDPWSRIHYYQNNRSLITTYMDRKLERKTLNKADKISTVSEHFGKLIEADKTKLHIIPNGYDEMDFAHHDKSTEDKTKFKIAYVGGLNENRFYPDFFKELTDFISINNLSKDNFSFIIAGQIQEQFLDAIYKIIQDPAIIDHKGYVSHSSAIDIMKEADLLLLFMEKVSNYSGHIPGKLFEYLASQKYILGVGDAEGDANNILRNMGAGAIFNNDHRFSKELSGIYQMWKQGQLSGAKKEEINSFSRENLSKQLTEIFEDM
jgi:glycosyltransferase involved in cell wall biosynthesis